VRDTSGFDTRLRIHKGLLIFAQGYRPFVEEKMQVVFGPRWIERASLASGSEPGKPLDVYGLVKTTLDRWNEVFRVSLRPPIRNLVSLVFEARNEDAHPSEQIADATAITYLHAMASVIAAVGAKDLLPSLEALKEEQVKAMALGLGMGQPVTTPLEPRSAPEPRGNPGVGKKLPKAEAIRRVNQRCKLAVLDNQNTRFANPNEARPDIWWLDVPLRNMEGPRAEDFIHLLLYDHRSNELYHLTVPPSYFREHLGKSPQLKPVTTPTNRKVIRLYLSTERSSLFRDVMMHPTNGCCFQHFACRCSGENSPHSL
jgi:hypothetical protein